MNLYNYASLFRQNIKDKEYDKIDFLIKYSDNLNSKYIELFKTNPTSELIKDPYTSLVNIYKNKDIFIGLENNRDMISLCEMSDINDNDNFLFYFDLITENILAKVKWSNMVVVGDIPLLALLYDPTSDNIYDIRDDIRENYRDFELDIYLYGDINLSDKIKDICRSIMNIMLFKPDLENKGDIIKLVPKDQYPIINIHTTVYLSPSHILFTIPIIESSKILFDNRDLWMTPRAHYNYVFSLCECSYNNDNNMKDNIKLLRLGYALDLTNIKLNDIDTDIYYKKEYEREIDKLIVQSKFKDIDLLHNIYKLITFSDNLSDDIFFEYIISDDISKINELLAENTYTSYNPLTYAIIFNKYDIFNMLLSYITDYTKPFTMALKLNRTRYINILSPKLSIEQKKYMIINNRDSRYINLIEDILNVDDIIDIINTNDLDIIRSINLKKFNNISEHIKNISDFNIFKNIILENKYLMEDMKDDIYDDKRRLLFRNLGSEIAEKPTNPLESMLVNDNFSEDPDIIKKYINERFVDGLTPFEYVMVHDMVNIASILLKYDVDHSGKNYVKLCAKNRSLRSIIFLNNYAKDIFYAYNEHDSLPNELHLSFIDELGNNILHYASDNKLILLINKLQPDLINKKNNKGITCVANSTNVTSLETFLQLGADILIKDNRGFNQFHNLIMNNTTDIDMVNICIRYIPDIFNICTKYENYTPLMLAIYSNNDIIAKYLIDQGANIDVNDIFGNTIYHYIVINNSSINIDMKNIQNIFRMTPYDYACRLGYEKYIKYEYNEKIISDKSSHYIFIDKVSRLLKDNINISYIIQN